MNYKEFLAKKKSSKVDAGFKAGELNQMLFPFQSWIVRKALESGRFAIFADFGLGKTFMQLEFAYRVSDKTGQRSLVGCAIEHIVKTAYVWP